jgi:hypothetical protein
MEYPMFVMNGYNTDEPTSVFRVNDHEHGHEWYPMIVGSNERRYAWMDEGFNTYINAFSNERFFPGTSAWTQYVTNWKNVVANGTQSPLMTRPDHVEGSALGAIAYRKPGAVLLALATTWWAPRRSTAPSWSTPAAGPTSTPRRATSSARSRT